MMIELIDMSASELFGGGVRRLGYSSFGEAIERAQRLIRMGSIEADHAAIKRAGGKAIIVFSDTGEHLAIDAARANGGAFVTLQVLDGGQISERWHYRDSGTGEAISEGPVVWESVADANIETSPDGLLI